MNENPYQPPGSGFKQPPRDREPGSTVKAVLLGAATDIGGTMAAGLVLGIVYALVLAAQGYSNDQITASFENIDPLSGFGLISSIAGLSMSVLGGYVCARVANVTSFLAIGILSAVSVTFGALMGGGEYEWPMLLALNLLSLAGIFFGGWLYIRKLTDVQ